MKRYIVKKNFYNGVSYKKGKEIKLEEDEAEDLKEMGLIEPLDLDEEFINTDLSIEDSSDEYSEESFEKIKLEFSKKDKEKIEKLSEEEKEQFYDMNKKERKDFLKAKE